MNSNPLRLRIMIYITNLLKTIAPDSNSATPFVNDLSQAVFRGRTTYDDGDPIPMASILEMPAPIDQLPTPPENASRHGEWDILIQGFCKDDKTNPTDPAYFLSADIIACLAIEKARPGRERAATGKIQTPLLGEVGVIDLRIGAPVHRPPDAEISSKAYLWLPITIVMAENLESPYA